jgi:hypothetical protein
MGEFLIPEGPLPRPAPPSDPRVPRDEKIANDTRVEQALNQFLAAKQCALFEAPDAFYRAQGERAIHAAPVATKSLEKISAGLLDGLANDYQRNRLGRALDAQMLLAREAMARHVAEQSLTWQRQVAQARIALLTKEAAHHHNDTDLVDALGHAAANAARAHARVGDGPPGGEAEDAAAALARSGVLGAAIQARLDRGDAAGADALLAKVQDQLDPQDATRLKKRLASRKIVVPVPPQIDPKDESGTAPHRFKPIVIIPWELQRPDIDFDFEKTPADEPPEDKRPSPPQGLPDENVG